MDLFRRQLICCVRQPLVFVVRLVKETRSWRCVLYRKDTIERTRSCGQWSKLAADIDKTKKMYRCRLDRTQRQKGRAVLFVRICRRNDHFENRNARRWKKGTVDGERPNCLETRQLCIIAKTVQGLRCRGPCLVRPPVHRSSSSRTRK